MSSQSIVAVFVSQSDRQQALHAALTEAGLQSGLVQSSEELHQLMNHQRVDALIIEQELPGFLTGLDILDRLKKQLLQPVTMLLGKLSDEDRRRAESLEIGHMVDGETGTGEIIKLLKRSLSSAAENSVSIPAAPRRLVQQSDFIRPMPQVVVRLAYYLSDDRATATELAKDISTDPRITADLLRMINSSAFGRRNQIVKVSDAVTALGIRRTACLIMMSAVQKVHAGFDRNLSPELLKWYRLRSLLTASSASSFAKLANNVSKDHAYTLALLQDLGILVMAYHHQKTYAGILERFRSVALLQLEACERQEFSFTHADVSAALLQQWGLPTTMVSLVLDHHDHRERERSRLNTSFLQLMRVGETIANMSDVPSPQRNAMLQPLLRGFNSATPTQVRECFTDAISTAAEMGKLFNVPIPQGDRWNELVGRLRDELVQPAGAEAALAAT